MTTTTRTPSRASLVAGDVAAQPGHEVDQEQLIRLCAERQLSWPGMNGGLFGGRSPWLERRGEHYRPSADGWRRLAG